MIDKNLIEKSLALCGIEYKDMDIEHYCYFLLSPEFLIAYNQKMIDTRQELHWGNDIGGTIAEYQSGNEEPLQELLSKIGN